MYRIGVVNLDTSHPLAFSRYLNKSDRAHYTAVYNDSFRGDDEVEAFMQMNGIEKRYDSVEEMAKNVDIGFVQGCNWDKHLEYAKAFIKAGKPVFMDKPFVGNLKDCLEAEKLGRIPLITYGMGKEAVEKVLDGGEFLLKIKIGSDPEGDHDPRKMLEWDKNRLTFLHELAKDRETPYTENGRIAYYLDANGRYPDRDTLLRFLDHADQIGALSRIVLLEEPLDEENDEDLSDVPVRVAADESAHCEADAVRRMDQGYRAVALKPIAKTLSMTFRILEAAHQRGIPCFCADLTVNPVMLEWNKNVAARIGALPGIRVGVVETNGDQNYKRWEEMCGYESCHGADFTRAAQGVFHLGKDFYRCSGGILEDSPYYSGQFGGEGK